MVAGVGAGGYVGIALETVSGTYEAPNKFVPINNESLQYLGPPQYRRPIKQSADAVWAVPSNVSIGGDIEMDALDDVLPYFMYASRMTVTKTGAAAPYTYAGVPNPNAVPQKTMSITVNRNGEIFGYVGCVVSSFRLAIDDGVLTYNVTIVGNDELEQTAPGTITWGTTTPYGAGQYNIEIPTGTVVTDTDTFEWTVEDNAEAQFRAKIGRGAQFVKFGERSVAMTVNRDFHNRDDYDGFKAITAQSITVAATKGVNASVTILMPSSIKDSYEMGLSGQGDLLRGAIAYTGIQGTGNSYQLTVKTAENVTVA